MAACLVYCVSGILFRMSLAMDVRCATYSVTVARCNDRDPFYIFNVCHPEVFNTYINKQ